MKFVPLACLLAGSLLSSSLNAAPEDPEVNVNSRYTVETVIVTGDGWSTNLASDHDQKISSGLRSDITALIGAKLNPTVLDDLARRLGIQRVAVMQKGKFIALGTPGELKARSNHCVRREVTLKEGLTLTGAQRTYLSELGTVEEVRSGQYRLYLPAEAVTQATDWVVTRLGLAQLDDFRLAPPSLEDVYLDLEKGSLSN